MNKDKLIKRIKENADSYIKLVKDKLAIDSDMETLIRGIYLDACADTVKEIIDMNTSYKTEEFNFQYRFDDSQIN